MISHTMKILFRICLSLATCVSASAVWAWSSYPRPQMMRDNWTSLNGEWDYAITPVTNTPGRPTVWQGKIRVPYPIESRLSGVGRLLDPDEFLWYTRRIECHPAADRRLLLHLDGIDFMAMVFIGHQEVTDVPHCGMHDPLILDITDYVKDGANELTICVWDPTGDRRGPETNSRGKQSLNPKGCFYTRASGIWQSVWMETVPAVYIEDYSVVTDIDAGDATIELKVKGEGKQRHIKIPLSRSTPESEISGLKVTHDLPGEFTCWSPENPKLYHFTARYGEDEIRGYFAMRKIEKRRDDRGKIRFFLNNRPYFLIGTLDQGWWPDGLITPPSEKEMVRDIEVLKACGYNTIRKHLKVEPLAYYAACDRLGMVVLQDLPCFNGDRHAPMNPRTVHGYAFQREELKRMIDHLGNVPSILMWIPYNEGWSQPGEFLTHATLDWTKRYDPTRLCGGPSGCWDWEGGTLLPGSWQWEERVQTEHKPEDECEAGDTVDAHLYRSHYKAGEGRPFPANDRRISFIGEFGGLGHPVAGHLYCEPEGGAWGYGGIEDTKTREGLEREYLKLIDEIGRWADEGLGGAIYTQTSDVEAEINGLLTYDRKVLKFNPAVLKAAHDALRKRVERAAFGKGL